ncbi:MAG: hypothetical protein ACTSRG_21040 [Candidatus Helarchaeota archaeon]
MLAAITRFHNKANANDIGGANIFNHFLISFAASKTAISLTPFYL